MHLDLSKLAAAPSGHFSHFGNWILFVEIVVLKLYLREAVTGQVHENSKN